MRKSFIGGLAVALTGIAALWIYLGSISDRLVGNLTMHSDPPVCDDARDCESYRDLFIADAHSDTLLHREPSDNKNAGHSDIRRLVEGGVNLQIYALASVAPVLEIRDGKVCGNAESGDRLTKLFVVKDPFRPATWVSPTARIQRMLYRFERALKNADESNVIFRKIETKADLVAVANERRSGTVRSVGAVLAVEGAYWAATDEAGLKRQLNELDQAGVRMIGLTHRASNHLSGSNEDCTDRNGLTALGHFAVLEIWRRHMILDLAHASSKTIEDVAELSQMETGGQVIVSHTGIQSACQHDRNLTDEDVRNVARAGGVIAIGFWSTVNCFDDSVSARIARQAVAHSFGIAHRILSAPEFAAELGSAYEASDHLALGSDFDGATLVPADAAAVPWYLEGISQVEMDDRRVFDFVAIEKIAGANLFDLLARTLKP